MIAYPGRILAIDYGTQRVGVATSDPTQMIAQGITTLENDKDLIDKLCKVVRDQNAVRVVVGMPYSADGAKGPKAQDS